MALYSIYANDKYRTPGFDDQQIREIFGDDIRNQFPVNYNPVPYADRWQVLDINFNDDNSGLEGNLIPDISVHYGRLYLSQKAYSALKDILTNDGEFLPIRSGGKDAYFFNPLKKSEDVDGLNKKLSVKNEWGDIENTAFYEDRVCNFMIFKTDFDHHVSSYCKEEVKNTIENAELKGVCFTTDLGNPFGGDHTQ